MLKLPVLHVYIPSKTNNSERTILPCQNNQSYMCTYILKQEKHKHKELFTKYSVLHVYIPYRTSQTLTQSTVEKMSSITCVIYIYIDEEIKK